MFFFLSQIDVFIIDEGLIEKRRIRIPTLLHTLAKLTSTTSFHTAIFQTKAPVLFLYLFTCLLSCYTMETSACIQQKINRYYIIKSY